MQDADRINRTPCSPANSILEFDLELAVKQKTLKKLTIAEIPEGFYIIAQFKWAVSKEWYLVTRRERYQPRIFKDLNRLNDHLKIICPTNIVEILRNQELPAKGEDPSPTVTAISKPKKKLKKSTKKG